FSGEGARLFGGRYNGKGFAVVYTSSSVALAALEMLVHLQAAEVLAHYRVRSIRFDESLVASLDRGALPPNWRDSPPPPDFQRMGDDWMTAGSSAVLRVP